MRAVQGFSFGGRCRPPEACLDGILRGPLSANLAAAPDCSPVAVQDELNAISA